MLASLPVSQIGQSAVAHGSAAQIEMGDLDEPIEVMSMAEEAEKTEDTVQGEGKSKKKLLAIVGGLGLTRASLSSI